MRRYSLDNSISVPQFRGIEPLRQQHDKLRAAFSCGVEPLDRYLKQQARQDARKRAAAPYVLVTEDNRIAGYYTLSSDNIRSDDLPPELVKQLKLPRYPVVGATLIGRLARDLAFRKRGVGELLLLDALKRSLAISQEIASTAVIVDAKDDNARNFYKIFGFVSFAETTGRLFLPMQTIEQLFSPESKPIASTNLIARAGESDS